MLWTVDARLPVPIKQNKKNKSILQRRKRIIATSQHIINYYDYDLLNEIFCIQNIFMISGYLDILADLQVTYTQNKRQP